MDDNVMTIIGKRLEKVGAALRANNMEAYIAENAQQAREIAQSLLNDGDTVSTGGSMTLGECGIYELLRSGRYNYLDRSAVSGEDIDKLYRQVFSADAYLCSANAVTEDGVLYNVDGNSNRVAAIAFGPRSVIVVAGFNKIVADLDEAVTRVKKTAAPANTVRLGCETYCAQAGECVSCKNGGGMTDGCRDNRICCNYLISARQRQAGRIKVILVKESLGY